MDKNYWSNVLKARKEIYNLITDFGISSVRSNADVNPLFSQITNNGGIGLEFYYGIPLYLYTPLGRIEIAGDFTIVRNEDAILERLIADYGAVLITRSIISSLMGVAMGEFGPVYALTRLPWTTERLPVFEYRSPQDYIGYDTAKELYQQVMGK